MTKWNFRKNVSCRQQWYPNQLYGSPLNKMYTLKYGESPNINDHKLLLAEFYKQVYENANIHLQSSKIIANISLKLICEEKCSRFGIPHFHIM